MTSSLRVQRVLACAASLIHERGGRARRRIKAAALASARKYRAGSLFSARVRSRRLGRAYDLAGRPLTVTDTTGQGLSYGLDSAKQVTSVAQTAPNITGTRTVSYVLDKSGNKLTALPHTSSKDMQEGQEFQLMVVAIDVPLQCSNNFWYIVRVLNLLVKFGEIRR